MSIKDVRAIRKWSLDDLADAIEAETGDRPTRGALSAIENGHRGASRELIQAMELAYGVREGAITTNYTPRATTSVDEVA